MSAHSSRWRRVVVAAGIVGFWLVMTGLLVLRVREQRAAAVVPAVPTGPDSGETWLGLFAGRNERIGTIHLVQTAEERHHEAGTTMRMQAELHLLAFGVPTDLRLSGSLWRALDGARASVEAVVRSRGHETSVRGAIVAGELDATLRTGGETIPVRLRLDPRVLGGGGLPWRLGRLPLALGQSLTVPAFDPITMRPAPLALHALRDESVTLGGAPEPARVVTARSGATTFTLWLGRDGDILQAETPFGLTVRRLSAAQAHAPVVAGAAADLVDRVTITPTGRTPFRGARRMVVRASGLDGGTALPGDDTQRAVAPGVYEIAPSPASPAERPAAAAASAESSEIAAALRAEPLVQADHPRIRAQAAAIVGGETDPWRRAVRLHDWVFAALEKIPVASVPSALDVLARRSGDCNEHAVLFTALARAAGIPTRIVVGVVWSEELGGFGYHAWPEVFVGRWVWMDPTLGQPVADATHLKLFTGGLAAWPQVLAFLGRLQLEVEEIA